ncbi:MAG: PTS fructose IIA subunit family protein [Gammaproteobacteria bacterium HGW-Gammaproteobacteria-4]|jgi:PTS system ascorbate-specific IIA component|nr:MAG: PTS fructose IIA subunit family protein [Gammaproteobacteria bacterium HGW-Gammaproteobacteria-4]
MSVAILLITHDGLGSPLIAVAERMLGGLPLPVAALDVPFDADPEAMLVAASGAMRRIDQGDGVLILSDLYGATPANIARRAAFLGSPVRRVAGLSLPMLLRALNYPDLDLDAMAKAAVAGARLGVIADDA